MWLCGDSPIILNTRLAPIKPAAPVININIETPRTTKVTKIKEGSAME